MIALYVPVIHKKQNFKSDISFQCMFIKWYEKILVHNFFWLWQINNFSNLVNTVILYKPEKVFALVSFISDPRNTNVKNTITCFVVKINFFSSDFYFQNGCSVRLLNPQTYSRNVWKLLSVLQEYFNCCVGANV